MSVKFFVRAFVSFFLIVSISLMNVSTVLAEGPTPPAATEEPTQDPAATLEQPDLVVTETPPAEETLLPEDPALASEDTTGSGPFSQLPENTEVVVLDETGDQLPLVSSESLNVILEEDPKWCPEGELPDSVNCTANLTISQLLDLMQENDNGKFNANGVIYFERSSSTTYTSSFILDDSDASLGASYDSIKNYNITLRGGWNILNNTLSSNTPSIFDNDANVVIRVGSETNPWVKDVTLKNITVQDNDGLDNANNPVTVNGPSVSVYTTTGNVTFDNVDVDDQADGQNTAVIDSVSGNITVTTRSTFDGTGLNQGFSATTDTGSITISGSDGSPITFTDASGSGNATNYNGATLSAPTVTLSYVTATGNDNNGIYITNANTVTLNTVDASNNGTNPSGLNNSIGSGVFVQAPTGGSNVTVTSGTFTGNERYGIEITNGTLTLNNTNPQPNFGNTNGYGQYFVNTAPVLSLPANITLEATGPAGAVVTYAASATDAQDNPDPTPLCSPASGSTFGIAISTVNCTATDSYGISTSGSFTVTVQDTTPPTIAAHGPEGAEATSSAGAVVTYTNPTTNDIVDGAGTATCAPASGSTFALGDTTVTCNATDAHNNPATPITFTVSVVDTTAPVIASHGPETAEATSPAGAVVTYSIPTTSDAVDGPGTATCAPASGSTFALGDTTVTCNATDAHNNPANPTTFTVSVVDTTGPVLNLPGNMTVEATSASGATVTYSVSALDAVDDARPVSCSPSPSSAFVMGLTTVNCSSTDTRNNTSNGSFTVLVADTTAPMIAVHGNETAEATSPAGAVVTYSIPTTSDAVDGAGVATCAPASGSTFALGSTTVTCNAMDAQGNAATPTDFTVSVLDTTAPVIAAHGDVVAEATSPAGAIVTYTSPATSDAVDGTGTATCLPASGTLFAVGNTVVTCNITDTYANVATPTTFNVIVMDTIAPVIAVHGNETAEATSPAGAVVTYSIPTTSDAVDGAGTATCAPASGSTFALGDTSVTCNATDTQGNAANPTTFTVSVVDTIAPVIAAHGNENAEATSSAGAAVTYTSPATSDIVDGAGVATCVPASGSIFALGDTTVTCNITDTHGNVATSTTFTVSVVDTTAPVIAAHSDVSAQTTSASGIVVNYSNPGTSDAVDGSGTATCAPASGSTFALGSTTVTCNATDSNGNAAVPVTFMVHVQNVTTTQVTSSSSSSSSLIPVTGGIIDLDCNTKVVINGIRVIFHNLCNKQAALNGVDVNQLPGKIPAGFTFVSGLDVTVLGHPMLPTNAGIEMDFPASASGQFAVLYWDNGKWVEVTQSLNESDLSKALSTDPTNELYKLVSSEKGMFKSLTTEKTGTFVLVKK